MDLNVDFQIKGLIKLFYLNDDYYNALWNWISLQSERRLEITRDIFVVTLQYYGPLYYNDLIAIEINIGILDKNLIKINPDFYGVNGERKKNGEEFFGFQLNQTSKRNNPKISLWGWVYIFPREVCNFWTEI